MPLSVCSLMAVHNRGSGGMQPLGWQFKHAAVSVGFNPGWWSPDGRLRIPFLRFAPQADAQLGEHSMPASICPVLKPHDRGSSVSQPKG